MIQRYLFLLILSLATHSHLHAAQMNVEVKTKEQTEKLSAEEHAAADKIFEIILATNKDNAAQQAQALQKLLQRSPRSVYAKDNNGKTTLMIAALYGHAEIVQLLIAAGAQIDVKNKYGYTALIFAAWQGHTKPVKLLIAADADLNTKDKYGITALMRAALNRHTEIVELLIAAGADETIQNEKKDRMTARNYAANYDHLNAYDAAVIRGKRELRKVLQDALNPHVIPDVAKIVTGYAV